MNSRERTLAAIDHREPDRLPITFDCEPEVLETLSQHFGAQSKEDVWDSLHVDTWLVGADHNDWRQRTIDGVTYDFWGIGSTRVHHAKGSYTTQKVHPLASLNTIGEMRSYNWPSPDELSFESIREARRRHPDRAIIAHITHAAFFKATQLCGMERFLTDMALDPELADFVIKRVNGYVIPAIERLCSEAGDSFDIFYIADDTCTSLAPMISQAMFERWILPYVREYADICHKYGKKLLLHTCGSVRSFLPALIDAGIDILEPIQTTATGMDPSELKDNYGQALTFYGSIDTIHLLPESSPEQVRDGVLEMYRTLGKDGGFIIGPSHTYMQNDVPLPNILEMYRTAFEVCRY